MNFYLLIVLAFLAGISCKIIYDRINFGYKYRKFLEETGEEDFLGTEAPAPLVNGMKYLFQVNYLICVLEEYTKGEISADEWFKRSEEYAKKTMNKKADD